MADLEHLGGTDCVEETVIHTVFSGERNKDREDKEDPGSFRFRPKIPAVGQMFSHMLISLC